MSLFDGKFCEQDEDDCMSLTQVNELIAKLQSDKDRLIEALFQITEARFFQLDERIDNAESLLAEMKGE